MLVIVSLTKHTQNKLSHSYWSVTGQHFCTHASEHRLAQLIRLFTVRAVAVRQSQRSVTACRADDIKG